MHKHKKFERITILPLKTPWTSLSETQEYTSSFCAALTPIKPPKHASKSAPYLRIVGLKMRH